MLITGLNDQGQKYPKPICRCNNSVFHAGEECPIHFEIDATIEIFYQFFHLWLWFWKSFQLCVFFFNLLQIAHKNHVQHFCFHQFVNPPLQSIFHLKWKMSSIWRPLPPFRKQIHIQWKKFDYVSSFKFMGIFVSNKSLFSESCYEI